MKSWDLVSLKFSDLRRQKVVRLLLAVLFLNLLVLQPVNVVSAPEVRASALDECSTKTRSNDLVVRPSHGKAFYIDSGVNPKIDAGYVGYRVDNESSTARRGLWVELSNFSGGRLSLVNPLDRYMSLETLTATGTSNETQTAYFMLKASGATTVDQIHEVRIYDKRPDLNGATVLFSCKHTFQDVQETIKAAANKIEDLDGGTAITVSTTTPQLGQSITIKVEGRTGVIGAGSSPDFSAIWLTPSGSSSWPTRSLKLTSVSILFDENANLSNAGDQRTFTNQIYIANANSYGELDSKGNGPGYVATYTFLVVSKPASSVKIVPVGQIASGTKMKHTDTGATGATADLTFSSFSNNISLTKTVPTLSSLETSTSPNGVAGSTEYVAVPYRLRVTNSAASSTTIDEIVDIPPALGIYKTGSASPYADPTYLSSEANLSPRPIHFVGPFTVPANSSIQIDYKVWVPNLSATYTNDAYIFVGDVKVGSSATATPRVNVTTNGTSSVTAETTTVSLELTLQTIPASSVDTSTAKLNATVYPNGNSGTLQFHWGTSPTLASYATTQATTPGGGSVSGSSAIDGQVSLSGLSQNTDYYFRAVVGDVYGEILNFKTLLATAAPVPLVFAATNVAAGGTTATFNGSVQPNNTFIWKIEFIWGTTNSDIANLTQTTAVTFSSTDSNGNAITENLQASGSSEVSFSMNVSNSALITTSNTIYYRVKVYTAENLSTSVTSATFASFKPGKLDQTINFTQPNSITWGDAATVSAGATATPSSLTVAYQSLTSSVCSVDSSGTISILTVGECGIRATQSGNDTYNAASAVDRSFAISPKAITVTAQDKSKVYGASTPSNSSLITGLAFSDTATVSSAIYTYSGTGSTSYSSSTSAPTQVGSYSLLPSSAVLSFTTGSSNNYLVNYVAGTYTISQKTLTITADNKAIESGTATPNFTSRISGLIGTDSATVTSATYTFTGTSGTSYSASTTPPDTQTVGTYSISPSAATLSFTSGVSSNYSLAYANGTYEILAIGAASKQEQTITFVLPSTITYGDSATVTSGATASSGLPITYESLTATICAVDASGVITILAVGDCTVRASQPGDGAYFAAPSVERTMVINPRPITVLASSKIKTYGDSDPSLTSFTISSGNLVGSDTFTVSASRDSGDDVGSRAINQSGATFSTGAASNYSINYQPGTLTINARPLTVTSSNVSKIYGASDPDLTGFTLTSGSLVGGDTFTVSTVNRSSPGVEIVGSYTITPSAVSFSSGSTSNYSIIFATGVLTITVKTITVKADNKTIAVGSQTPTFTSTVLGLAFSETATVTAGTYSFKSGAGAYTTTEPDTSTAGVYDLKVDTATVSFGGSASNYSATYLYETGTYTISNLTPQTIVLDNSSLAYNASINLTTLLSSVGAGSGVVSYTTDDASKCSLSGANNVTLTAASGTGSCVITATKAADATYASASDTATITLSKINQTITFNTPSNMTVGGATQSVTPTTTSSLTITITSTTLTICTISGGVVTAVAAGSCGLTAAQGGNDNYNPATNQTVTFTISAAAVNNSNGGGAGGGGGGSAPAPRLRPTINWNNPDPIENETPLGNTQLNARCSVPGTLVYSPAAGTVLPPGTHTLTVTCFPLDSNTYEPVSTTVQITVIAPPPNAISHRIIFPSGGACITGTAVSSFERFLSRVRALSDEEFDTQIYLSGGFFNEDLDMPMTEEAKARYQCLCDSLLKNGVSGQIFTGIFSGPRNTVEVIISWVRK